MRTAAITYARHMSAVREIMDSYALPPAKLHVVRTTAQMFDTVFAAQYETLMQPHADMSDKAIFEDISATIRKGIEAVKAKNNTKTGISTTALTIALEKLMGV